MRSAILGMIIGGTLMTFAAGLNFWQSLLFVVGLAIWINAWEGVS